MNISIHWYHIKYQRYAPEVTIFAKHPPPPCGCPPFFCLWGVFSNLS